MIFLFGLGIGGAAISTVISEYVKNVVNLKFQCAQCMDFHVWHNIIASLLFHYISSVHYPFRYLIAFILLWKLNDRVLFMSPNIDGMRIVQYLKSGTSLCKFCDI